MQKMGKKSLVIGSKGLFQAFTLAEVLITLTIIGVVAMLTIPNLITDVQNKQFATLLRKRHAEFSQAIKLSVIDNGRMSGWDWSADTDDFISEYLAPYLKMSSCDDCWTLYSAPKGLWFEQPAFAADYVGDHGTPIIPDISTYTMTDEEQLNCYIGGTGTYCSSLISNCNSGNITSGSYFTQSSTNVYTSSNGAAMCTSYKNGEYNIEPADTPAKAYALADGSQVGFFKKDKRSVLFIYLDLNGEKSPNKYGIDKYVMLLGDNTLAFWGEGESDLTSGDYGCSTSGNGMYCGALLKKNDWKFDENYPNL